MANSVEQIKKDEVQIVETPATGPTTASTETPSEDVKVEIEAGKEQPAAPATKLAAPLSREEAEKEILRQVEFYFSDVNLPYDKFLWTLSRKEDGWVPLSTLCSFKRMRPLREVVSEKEIIALLQEKSSLLEINAKDKKIRRKTPIERPTDSYERSIYAKGFPDETDSLQKDLEKFFAHFGHINAVRMRRDEKASPKTFKGSVFVEFASMDDVQKILKRVQDGEQIRYKSANAEPLQIMSKDDYCQMKMKEKGIDPSTALRGGGKTKGINPINRPGKFNAFEEMEKERQGSHASQSVKCKEPSKPKRSDPLKFEFNGKTLVTREDGTVDPGAVEFPEKSVIAFSNAGEGGNWKDLKERLFEIAETSFVDFPVGATSGAAGFKQTLSDEQFESIINSTIEVAGKPVTWSRVEEERAKQFYLDRVNFRAKFLLDQREQGVSGADRLQSFGGRGRGGGRGGKPGRGRGRGGFQNGGGHHHSDNIRGQKRKRNIDEDLSGTKGGGEAPSLSSAKKVKADE